MHSENTPLIIVFQKSARPHHPCMTQVQKAVTAREMCSKLEYPPFTRCEQRVHPIHFIEGCEYDICARDGSVESLCTALEAYTKECADQGVIIEWRNKTSLHECGTWYQTCRKVICATHLSQAIFLWKQSVHCQELASCTQ